MTGLSVALNRVWAVSEAAGAATRSLTAQGAAIATGWPAEVLSFVKTQGYREIYVVLMPDAAEARTTAATPAEPIRVRREAGGTDAIRRVVVRYKETGQDGRDAAPHEYIASAPEQWLRRIVDLIERDGITVSAVCTADSAWLATAGPGGPDGGCILAVQLDGQTVPQLRLVAGLNGLPMAIRRLRPDADIGTLRKTIRGLSACLKERTSTSPVCLALGDAQFRDRIRDAASQAAIELAQPAALVAELDYSPGLVAAAFAGHGPRFVPPNVIAAGKRRQRRGAWLVAAATAALLILSAVLETQALGREIAHVRDARSAIAHEVDRAVQARSGASDLSDALAGLSQLESATPRWTEILTGVSEQLPLGSHATSVRVVGDSIYLELQGDDAGATFEALRQIPGLRGFRAAAPIQRDVTDGDHIVEHFTAAATVSWPTPAQDGGKSR